MVTIKWRVIGNWCSFFSQWLNSVILSTPLFIPVLFPLFSDDPPFCLRHINSKRGHLRPRPGHFLCEIKTFIFWIQGFCQKHTLPLKGIRDVCCLNDQVCYYTWFFKIHLFIHPIICRNLVCLVILPIYLKWNIDMYGRYFCSSDENYAMEWLKVRWIFLVPAAFMGDLTNIFVYNRFDPGAFVNSGWHLNCFELLF